MYSYFNDGLSFVTENIKYMWNPGKTSKNEIMRGNMTSERIKTVIDYGVKNLDSWGNPIITEEGLKFLYRYNKCTIKADPELESYIRSTVINIRKYKLSNNRGFFLKNDEGIIEELNIDTNDIDWL